MQQRLVFLILLLSAAIAVSPMDAKSKTVTSATAATAGFWVVGQDRKRKQERIDALTQGELDLAKSIRKFTKQQADLEDEKRKLQADREAIAELKREAELQKRLTEKDLAATEKELLLEAARRERRIEGDIRETRRKAAKRLWQVHRLLWRARRAAEAQAKALLLDAAKKEQKLEEDIQEVRREAARKLWKMHDRAWEMRKAIEARGVEDAIAQAEVELEEKRGELRAKEAELEDRRQALEAELDEAHAEMQAELNQVLEQAEKVLVQRFEDEKKAWMVKHVKAYDAKCKELDTAKTRIRLLREEIAEMQDIKLSKETGTAHGDRANIVLIWLKNQGIYANCVFSGISPSGVFQLGFDLWVEDPKTVAKIERLLPLLENKLGSAGTPTLGYSKHSRCWVITALPSVVEERENLNDLYKRSPDTELPSTFRDLEPHLRDAIAAELSYQQQEEEIKNLIPPVPLPRPNTHAISWLEIACLKHYMYYRQEATKGREPNVTTKAELLEIVYGVKKGYSTQRRDPILDESLSQRYDRAMRLIEGEEVNHV